MDSCSVLELESFFISFETPPLLVCGLKTMSREGAWPTKGQMFWVCVCDPQVQLLASECTLDPSPHPSHGIDHSLKRLWSQPRQHSHTKMEMSRPSWPLFHHFISQPVNFLPLRPQSAPLVASICLRQFVCEISQAINWEMTKMCLTPETQNLAGQPNRYNRNPISAAAYWYAVSRSCHCWFSSHSPPKEPRLQPRCSISSQGHSKTQHNYLWQRHGSKQRTCHTG